MTKAIPARSSLKISFRTAAVLLPLLLLNPHAIKAQETIVAVRHGEKPPGGLGQLACKGLNRALALPKVLIPRFGKPDAIYAPNPAADVNDRGGRYSYVRPLVTIEPTAIALGMPVNAQIGFSDISELQSELTAPENANAVIFLAWEHVMLNRFAQQMLRSYGEDPALVPAWPNSDYDRIYVFKIEENNGKPHLTFTVEHEGLNDSLSDTCPAP